GPGGRLHRGPRPGELSPGQPGAPPTYSAGSASHRTVETQLEPGVQQTLASSIFSTQRAKQPLHTATVNWNTSVSTSTSPFVTPKVRVRVTSVPPGARAAP